MTVTSITSRSRPLQNKANRMKPQLIIFSFGPSYFLDGSVLKEMFRSRVFLAFAIPASLLVSLVFVPPYGRVESFYIGFAISVICGIVFFLVVYLVAWLHLLLSQVWEAPGYAPISYFIAALTSSFTRHLANATIDPSFKGTAWDVFYIALHLLPPIIALEQLFIRLFYQDRLEKYNVMTAAQLLKHSRSGDAPRSADVLDPKSSPQGALAPDPAQAEVPSVVPMAARSAAFLPSPAAGGAPVEIGGRFFDASQIRLLEAQEHYLRVFTTDDSFLVRDRISVICSALPDTMGMRIHRSYWISFAAAGSVLRTGPGRYAVENAAGAQVPLSRHLKAEYETRHAAWLRDQAQGQSA
ncbi:hypothetical protein C5F44_09840 [Fuscovulum blasticum DSM 2131]|uniref:HTH LytTR-type domain-containing protein n=2 Tax=Fuscovulum blasticum TaxID=1075 RepID=A0A2T4J8S3_FUSBL|nr:hypothetical protein C5F44_09840 [Fuscovulum blasticum DSM 2131]